MDIRCGLIIILVILLLTILNMIRSGKMSMRYAFLWIILTAILLIAAIAPGFLDTLAGWLGFEVTSNMIFVVAIFLLLLISISLTRIVSEQSLSITLLTQEVSLLKKELDDIRENQGIRTAQENPKGKENRNDPEGVAYDQSREGTI